MDIAAHIEIRQLIARYSDAVWRQDPEAFAACWSSQGEWSMIGSRMIGHEAILAGWRASMQNFSTAWQTTHNIVLDIAGNDASGRLYVEEFMTSPDGSVNFSRGIYHDDYVVEDGAWRFARRHYDLVYFGPPDFSGRMFAVGPYGAAPRDPDRSRPATPSPAEFAGA